MPIGVSLPKTTTLAERMAARGEAPGVADRMNRRRDNDPAHWMIENLTPANPLPHVNAVDNNCSHRAAKGTRMCRKQRLPTSIYCLVHHTMELARCQPSHPYLSAPPSR